MITRRQVRVARVAAIAAGVTAVALMLSGCTQSRENQLTAWTKYYTNSEYRTEPDWWGMQYAKVPDGVKVVELADKWESTTADFINGFNGDPTALSRELSFDIQTLCQARELLWVPVTREDRWGRSLDGDGLTVAEFRSRNLMRAVWDWRPMVDEYSEFFQGLIDLGLNHDCLIWTADVADADSQIGADLNVSRE